MKLGRPNCCKKLTKRRLLARRPSGRLASYTLDGRHAARISILQGGARDVPRGCSLCEAVLQFMRTSLARRQRRDRNIGRV
jgi:hypothetical protein